MPIRISKMRDEYFGVQVVGNYNSLKRMVASIYLMNAQQSEQTLKVCICDDLPHVIQLCDKKFHNSHGNSYEMLQKGMILSVAHDRSLTVFASVMNNERGVCKITPAEEVILEPPIVWQSEAILTVEYKVHITKPNEAAAIQISILSQDDGGNEIPLCVPPRVRAIWKPKNITGVAKIRKAIEGSNVNKDATKRSSWSGSKQPYLQQYFLQARNNAKKTQSLPRHQQPAFSAVQNNVEQKARDQHERQLSADRTSTSSSYNSDRASTYSDKTYSSWYNNDTPKNNFSDRKAYYNISPEPVNNSSNWNVVRSPTSSAVSHNDRNKDLRMSGQYDNKGEPLPQWAKGLGDQFNYDDVVVV